MKGEIMLIDGYSVMLVIGVIIGIAMATVANHFKKMFAAKHYIRSIYADLTTYKPEFVEKSLGFRIEKRESL